MTIALMEFKVARKSSEEMTFQLRYKEASEGCGVGRSNKMPELRAWPTGETYPILWNHTK